jgi:hypothetical protein
LQDICYLDSNFKLNEADFHILQDYLYLQEMTGYRYEDDEENKRLMKKLEDLQPLYNEVWKRNNLHWPQPINPKREEKYLADQLNWIPTDDLPF